MTDNSEPTLDLTAYQVGDVVKVHEVHANTLRGARLITPAQHAAVLAGGTVESVEDRAYPSVRFGRNDAYDANGSQAHRVPAIWLTLVERPARQAVNTEQTSDRGLLLAQLGREIDVLKAALNGARSVVGTGYQATDIDRLAQLAESVQVTTIAIATLVETAAGDGDLRTLMLLSLSEAGFTFEPDDDIEPNNISA